MLLAVLFVCQMDSLLSFTLNHVIAHNSGFKVGAFALLDVVGPNINGKVAHGGGTNAVLFSIA